MAAKHYKNNFINHLLGRHMLEYVKLVPLKLSYGNEAEQYGEIIVVQV